MFDKKTILLNHLASTIRGQISASQYYTSGTKHTQAWNDYGYPEYLSFDHHYQIYLRSGPAKAGINMPVDTCWKSHPIIFEGGDKEEAEARSERTEWELNLDSLIKLHRLWKKLKAADRRQCVYQYGALIVQVRGSDDEANWSKPLKKINPEQIVNFIPVYQKQLEPGIYDDNQKSERYGLPITYNFQENNIFDNREEEQRLRQATIHYSRVIVFAEGADDGSIYGTPALEAGFNHLLDMIKIAGASGEGFWQNSKLKTVYANTDKDAPQPSDGEIEAIDNALQDFVSNLDSYIMTGGLKPELLQSNLPNPKEHFATSLGMFSSSLQVPVPQNMLMGTQTGVLASNKDGAFFLSNCQSRRENWNSQMIESLIVWLIDHGVIERKQFIISWDDLMAMGQAEKLDMMGKISEKASKYKAVTGEELLSTAEIRMIGGYKSEPEKDLLKSELTEDDDENGDGNER